MARTLEDLLNELISLDNCNRKQASPSKQEAVQVQLRSSQAVAVKGNIPSGLELPDDVMQELQLPYTLAGIFNSLQQFHTTNRHKPFVRAGNDTVVYVENDQMLGIVRVYLGRNNSVQTRGNGGSMTFKLDHVFEYQQQLVDNSVLVRDRKPEDFLCSPDRAQGKPVETLIFFSVFPDCKNGVSTFSIRPEYVKSAKFGSMKIRRMA